MIDDLTLLTDQKWRLNNLYRIINKEGQSIPFKLNPVQETVLDGMHTRNVLLKARQLGASTFSVLYILDETLFNSNVSSGIVSYSRDHAEHIFRKIIGHALDSLSPVIKQLIPVSQRSMSEISFVNGSSIRVGTTLRGGTCQNLLVSEFGKTCARDPLKSEEVVTGTLQTVPDTGKVIIESTGEGGSGFFYEMCNNAVIRGNENLSCLEQKLFFFSWNYEKKYSMKGRLKCDDEMLEYFKNLEEKHNIILTEGQKVWYYKKSLELGDKMRQEYPSTISEAFLSNSDAYYYQQYIEKAYNDNRCLTSSVYDQIEPIYVAMDIGVNDLTVIIFFQVIHGEIRIIDYYEDNNKTVDFYVNHLLNDKQYIYKTVFLPHDSKQRAKTDKSIYERDFKRLMQHTDTKIIVLPRTDKHIMISNVKLKFSRCVFAIKRVKKLLDMINKYKKTWSEQLGRYLDKPLHDISSNHADAMAYMAMGVSHIEAVGQSKGLSPDEMKRLNARNRRML